METLEQLKAMDGTVGYTDYMEINGNLYNEGQFEEAREYVLATHKRWPKGLPREYKVNVREIWTWKFRYDRFGYPVCTKENERFVKLG